MRLVFVATFIINKKKSSKVYLFLIKRVISSLTLFYLNIENTA